MLLACGVALGQVSMLGRGPSARIAAADAVRHPARSTRATIGVVIGVTLVPMFAVAAQGYVDMITRGRESHPADYAGVDEVLALTIGVFAVLAAAVLSAAASVAPSRRATRISPVAALAVE
jgi:putative ABC transport system permease protein